MYIDTQLGRVGLKVQDAKAKSLDIKVATLIMENVARAIETGQTRGMMKAVVDSRSKKILGASILGSILLRQQEIFL